MANKVYVKRVGESTNIFTNGKVYEAVESATSGNHYKIIADNGNSRVIGKESGRWEVLITENRQARKGETVLVNRPDSISVANGLSMNLYTVDIYTARGVRITNGKTLSHGEYVVVVNENQNKTQMEEVKMENVQFEVGNVVVALANGCDITEGKGYIVTEVLDTHTFRLKDDDGDTQSVRNSEFKLIAKAARPGTACRGDMIIAQTDYEGKISTGDILKATRVDSDGDINRFEKVDGEEITIGGYLYYDEDEYMVLLNIVEDSTTETPLKTKYVVTKTVEVNNNLRDYDKVIMTEDYTDGTIPLTKGDIVKVTNASSRGDKFDRWRTDSGDHGYTSSWVMDRSFKLLQSEEIDFTAQITEALQIIETESNSSNYAFTVDEQARKVTCKRLGYHATAEYVAPEGSPFIPEVGKAVSLLLHKSKTVPESLMNLIPAEEAVTPTAAGTVPATAQNIRVGTKVKVKTANPKYSLGEVRVGDVGVVIHANAATGEFTADFERQSHWSGVPSDVDVVVEELKTGDRVKLLNGGNKYPLYGFHDGQVYTVKSPTHKHDGNVTVKIAIEGSTDYGYARKEQLELVIEAVETTRPTVGDVVEVLGTGSASNCKVGDIVQIVRDDNDSSPYKVKNKDGVVDGFLKEVHVRKIFSTNTQAAPAPKRLTVDDFAKMKVTKNGIAAGTLVKIRRDDRDGEPYKVITADGNAHNGFMREADLEAATEEQFNEAVKAAKGRFTIGDVVKTKVVCDGLPAGTVVRIRRDDEDSSPYSVETLDKSKRASYYAENEVESLSEEEWFQNVVKEGSTVTLKVRVNTTEDGFVNFQAGAQSCSIRKEEFMKVIRG